MQIKTQMKLRPPAELVQGPRKAVLGRGCPWGCHRQQQRAVPSLDKGSAIQKSIRKQELGRLSDSYTCDGAEQGSDKLLVYYFYLISKKLSLRGSRVRESRTKSRTI